MNSMEDCEMNRPCSEAELQAELLLYREVFEYAPIGIIQTSLEGRILKANPAMTAMLGYDPVGNALETLGDIGDVYAGPEKRDQLLALALKQGRLSNYETRFRRRDGAVITCRLHLRVVRDGQGQIRFLESFIEDISEQKKTATALAESERLYRGIFENTGAGTIIIVNNI